MSYTDAIKARVELSITTYSYKNYKDANEAYTPAQDIRALLAEREILREALEAINHPAIWLEGGSDAIVKLADKALAWVPPGREK